jgi:hypothetical protein
MLYLWFTRLIDDEAPEKAIDFVTRASNTFLRGLEIPGRQRLAH